MKKIIDIKNISSQDRLMLGIALLLVVMFATFLLNNIFGNRYNIDYKKINVDELYNDSLSVSDREVYWILSNIISEFITSYEAEISGTAIDSNKYSREDFYNVISNQYSKVLSKRKYLEKSKEMLDKFVINNMTVKKSDYIEGIKELDEEKYSANMYIVKLKTVAENTKSYIGIKIVPNTRNYSIFYLE